MSAYEIEPPAHLGRSLTTHLLTGIFATVAVAGGLSLLYVLAPVPTEPWTLAHFIAFVVVSFSVFIAVTVGAVVRLTHSNRPLITGLVFVVLMATVLVLAYSWLYLSMSYVTSSAFTEPLTKASAVYFTVTVLSTVGFGDITPVGDIPRLVVTSQMIVGFTVITVAIKTITASTGTAMKRKHSSGKDKRAESDLEHDMAIVKDDVHKPQSPSASD